MSGRGAGEEPGDDDAIRTDAVMNLASAGGPLVDLDGKLVGINRAGRDPGSRLAGFGSAIPAERARRFAADLADLGRVRHGYLGLMIGPAGGESDPSFAGPAGLLVTGVNAGGPAEDAGIHVGDRIVALDGKPISGLETLSRAVDESPVGHEFRLSIDRAGKRLEITVKSRTRPDSPRAFPGPFGPAPRGLSPGGRRGERPGETGPKAAAHRDKPVLRSESQDKEPAREPEPLPR